jgi:hypothetical protein
MPVYLKRIAFLSYTLYLYTGQSRLIRDCNNLVGAVSKLYYKLVNCDVPAGLSKPKIHLLKVVIQRCNLDIELIKVFIQIKYVLRQNTYPIL